MLHCWDSEPYRRPDFRQLTEIFESMITTDVEYLEVRSLIVTNRTYFGGDLVPAPCQFRGETCNRQLDVQNNHRQDANDGQCPLYNYYLNHAYDINNFLTTFLN